MAPASLPQCHPKRLQNEHATPINPRRSQWPRMRPNSRTVMITEASAELTKCATIPAKPGTWRFRLLLMKASHSTSDTRTHQGAAKTAAAIARIELPGEGLLPSLSTADGLSRGQAMAATIGARIIDSATFGKLLYTNLECRSMSRPSPLLQRAKRLGGRRARRRRSITQQIDDAELPSSAGSKPRRRIRHGGIFLDPTPLFRQAP